MGMYSRICVIMRVCVYACLEKEAMIKSLYMFYKFNGNLCTNRYDLCVYVYACLEKDTMVNSLYMFYKFNGNLCTNRYYLCVYVYACLEKDAMYKEAGIHVHMYMHTPTHT
jgi:hypothetical protein